MIDFKRLNLLCFILLFFLTPKVTFSDKHNIYEVIELLKKDIKGLYNLTADDNITKYDFGVRLSTLHNLKKNISNIVTMYKRQSLKNKPIRTTYYLFLVFIFL